MARGEFHLFLTQKLGLFFNAWESCCFYSSGSEAEGCMDSTPCKQAGLGWPLLIGTHSVPLTEQSILGVKSLELATPCGCQKTALGRDGGGTEQHLGGAEEILFETKEQGGAGAPLTTISWK